MTGVIVRQYQQSPVILGIAQRINEIIQTELIDSANTLEQYVSVLNARGEWLDRIGERFDIPRPALRDDQFLRFGFDDAGVGFDQAIFGPERGGGTPIADETYRRLILARGGQLLTDASGPSLDQILETAFGSGHYIDHQDLTVTVRIDGDFRTDELDLIIGTGLVTKPAGVRIREIIIVPSDGAFGFDDNGVGFDQAPFARII